MDSTQKTALWIGGGVALAGLTAYLWPKAAAATPALAVNCPACPPQVTCPPCPNCPNQVPPLVINGTQYIAGTQYGYLAHASAGQIVLIQLAIGVNGNDWYMTSVQNSNGTIASNGMPNTSQWPANLGGFSYLGQTQNGWNTGPFGHGAVQFAFYALQPTTSPTTFVFTYGTPGQAPIQTIYLSVAVP